MIFAAIKLGESFANCGCNFMVGMLLVSHSGLIFIAILKRESDRTNGFITAHFFLWNKVQFTQDFSYLVLAPSS